MSKKYTAIVKKIKMDTYIETKDHADSFCMPEKIGKTIIVREFKPNWYKDEHYWNYHSSWLKQMKEIK